MPLPVVALLPEDWAAFRDIRLRALEDAPDAFGMTLAGALTQDEASWRERLAAPGPTYAVRTAPDGPAVAMGGLWTPDDHPAGPDLAMVWGMWTAPEARGRGHAGRLLDVLVVWCAAAGRHDLRLHVAQGNEVARSLYLAHGFEPTGEWEPLREGSPLQMETLRRRLG